MDFSISSVKLDFECVKKANLSNNTAKTNMGKLKREDHWYRDVVVIYPHFQMRYVTKSTTLYS